MVSFTSWPLYSRRNNPRYPLSGMLGGSYLRSGLLEKKTLLPVRGSNVFVYSPKHTLYTLPARAELWACLGPDSLAGIAARYGLDGPAIESRWGRDFVHPSRPSLGPIQPHTMGTGFFPGVERPGRDADHPPHLEPMLKKE
jgi:hypothetical protein